MNDCILNDGLKVWYLLNDVEIKRTMNQAELAALCLEDDIFLISVNEQGAVHLNRKS